MWDTEGNWPQCFSIQLCGEGLFYAWTMPIYPVAGQTCDCPFHTLCKICPNTSHEYDQLKRTNCFLFLSTNYFAVKYQIYPYLRGRIFAQARHIWPSSWPLGCCRLSGWGERVGHARGWCHSGLQRTAGRSLACHQAWGTRLVCTL